MQRMDAEVRPSDIGGEITPPPSKSETHRGLFASALAGDGTVVNALDSHDTRATATVIEALGGSISWSDERVTIDGFPECHPEAPEDPIDCANSGTTLRLATSIAALGIEDVTLTGDSSLRRRPNGPLLKSLEELGVAVTSHRGDGSAPLTVSGPLQGGETSIDGSVSSQFISSLLLAAPCTETGISVELTSPLQSAPYLALTLETLRAYDIEVTASDNRYEVPGGQRFRAPDTITIGPDPTAASYPLAAGVIAGTTSVTVTDVGDRGGEAAPILSVLRDFGIEPSVTGRAVTVHQQRPEPTTIDLGSSPDLLPTAAVIAALANGTSHLINCEHARYKETDRIRATADALRELGIPVTDRQDGLTIRGRPSGFVSGEIDPRGDHRLAMAAAIAGLGADGPVRIRGADCVNVSYPGFFGDIESLGADIAFPNR